MTAAGLARASPAGASAQSWRRLPVAQQPPWPDVEALRRVTAALAGSAVVVPAHECEQLTSELAGVAAGEAFVLQAGACAESFDEDLVSAGLPTVHTLVQMAAVLGVAARKPVVTIGRVAGQYCKPRSEPTETRDGVTLPSYRGDGINGPDFTPAARVPDPRRLLTMYERSTRSAELLRALAHGGRPAEPRAAPGQHPVAEDIVRLMRLVRAGELRRRGVSAAGVYTSHEALVLDYEAALTRTVAGRTFAGSGHMVWVGERTRDLDGAHVEYLSTIDNPIGIKLGPTADPRVVVDLLDRLDPCHRPGRLTLITRMGARQVRSRLPQLIRTVSATAHPVVWSCDPMHGNTIRTPAGYKTRRCADIIEETEAFFDVHRVMGTHPGGVHVEVSGTDVTECLGGVDDIETADLHRHYTSRCDPRLSRNQAVELAFHIASFMPTADRIP